MISFGPSYWVTFCNFFLQKSLDLLFKREKKIYIFTFVVAYAAHCPYFNNNIIIPVSRFCFFVSNWPCRIVGFYSWHYIWYTRLIDGFILICAIPHLDRHCCAVFHYRMLRKPHKTIKIIIIYNVSAHKHTLTLIQNTHRS